VVAESQREERGAVRLAQALVRRGVEDTADAIEQGLRESGKAVRVLQRPADSPLLDAIALQRARIFSALGARGIVCLRFGRKEATFQLLSSVPELGAHGARLDRFIREEVEESFSRSAFLEDPDVIGLLVNTPGLVEFLGASLELEVAFPPVDRGRLPPNAWIYRRSSEEDSGWGWV
jgi:hypothetical protein